MDLEPGTAETYVRLAFTQMLAAVDRLGDPLVNERPFGSETNSVAALVTHCCGVSEFWLGCVGLGRPTTRVRDEEFTATATTAELHEMVRATQRQIDADIRSLDAGEASSTHHAVRETLEDADVTDAALVLHLLEELYQHLGHMQLTVDALEARP
jgi:uncharacterized damage-inducible protein DinB